MDAPGTTPPLDALLRSGWQEHEKATAQVAASLEGGVDLVETADQGARVVQLANHAIGQHLGDWTRAARLADAVLERLHGRPLTPALLGLVAVGKYLGGDVAAGLGTEARAAALAQADAAAVVVRTRMLVAEALWGVERLGEALRLYEDALLLADALPPTTSANRVVAVVSNNLASGLRERAGRTPAEDATMLRAAHAARAYWLRVGDWTNDERSDYLLALVTIALGDFEEAVLHAERGLTTIERGGEEPVDAAFLHLARAEAYRGLGLAGEHGKALAEADRLAAGFPDAGLKDWYGRESARAR